MLEAKLESAMIEPNPAAGGQPTSDPARKTAQNAIQKRRGDTPAVLLFPFEEHRQAREFRNACGTVFSRPRLNFEPTHAFVHLY
jgi:hypothetical protein